MASACRNARPMSQQTVEIKYVSPDSHRMMQSFSDKVEYYRKRLSGKDSENAFHALIEFGAAATAQLVAHFRQEPDEQVRGAIVDIVAQCRDRPTIGFFSEALEDPSPEVWNAAIDALVSLGTDSARSVLQASGDKEEVRDSGQRSGFCELVKEAILQIPETE